MIQRWENVLRVKKVIETWETQISAFLVHIQSSSNTYIELPIANINLILFHYEQFQSELSIEDGTENISMNLLKDSRNSQ